MIVFSLAIPSAVISNPEEKGLNGMLYRLQTTSDPYKGVILAMDLEANLIIDASGFVIPVP